MNIIESVTSIFPTWIFQGMYLQLILFGYPLFKFISYIIFALIKLILPMPDLKKRYCHSDKQSWAVVTGATDGIGLGFCKVLTKMGFNIVLISRNNEKLNSTVELLKGLQQGKTQKSQFKTIVFDFRDSSNKELVDAMIKQLQVLDICLLINNVGTNYLGYHLNASHQVIVDLININCTSMSVLMSRLLHGMNSRGKKSAIINVSSLAGERGIPYLGLYSATKSFTNKLSQGLGFEYPGIDILSLRPSLVESKLSNAKPSLFVPTGEKYALGSLRELVYEHESYGIISHQIIGYIYSNLIPNMVFKNFVGPALQKLFFSKKKR